MYYQRVGVFLIAVALAACAPAPIPVVTSTAALPVTSSPSLTSTVDLSYDPAPGIVIIDADFQPGIAGVPYHQGITCRYETIPRLRIWGDGLVFLEVSEYGKSGPPLWTGHLNPPQIQDVLTFLSEQGFLDGWTPSVADGPNPAATWIGLGVHLKNRSILHGSGNLDWALYAVLVARLLPNLTPLLVQPTTDARITGLNIDTLACTTPTEPDMTATLAVLETQQPPTRLGQFVGICECRPGNADLSGLVIQNSWQRQFGSEWVLVVAGAGQSDPDFGVVGVVRNLTLSAIYSTPTRSGRVRITAEHNNRLTLQSTQGATFYFDVPNEEFVTSATEFIPTPTTTPAPYLIPSSPPLTPYP